MKLGIARVLRQAAALLLVLIGVSACNDNNGGTQPKDSLTISATSVNAGDPVTLSWTSSANVTSCNATGTDPTDWAGVVADSGSLTFKPANSGNFTYELDCYSVGAVATATVTLAVNTVAVAVSPAGQSLAGIDPVNNTVWVPTYTLDAQGNLQFVVVSQSDVAPAAVPGVMARALKPLASGTGQAHVSLPKCDTPIAVAYATNIASFLVECSNSNGGQVYVQVVKTAPVASVATTPVTTITATGVSNSGTWGGILFNPNTNKAVVAGTYQIGILDVPTTGAATFEADSVIHVDGTDSLSLNFSTQLLLVSNDGTNYTIDTSVRPLVVTSLQASNFNEGYLYTTDGNAFDSSTNIAVISDEVGSDYVFALNFNGVFDAAGGTPPATMPVTQVTGLGWVTPAGEGPGGEATVNTTTHQAVIADEFGPNFWLMQLPTAKVTGALDNNGQPGSGTTADANSVYAIAAGLIPPASINNTATPLGIRGDPSALGIDQVHNIGYFLADTDVGYHTWSGNTGTPLFLVAVDLSNPPAGGCAAGITQNGSAKLGCTTTWNPNITMLYLNPPAQ